MGRLLVWLIRLYQRLSRLLPPVCRFHPTCSEYTVQAIQTHGVWRGLLLGGWRLLRCNPLCAGGEDPVPPARPRPPKRRRRGEHCPTENGF